MTTLKVAAYDSAGHVFVHVGTNAHGPDGHMAVGFYLEPEAAEALLVALQAACDKAKLLQEAQAQLPLPLAVH